MKKITLLLIFVFLLCNGLRAQYFTSDNKADDLFLVEVKTIDEFMDRFNDDWSSFIRHVFAKKNKPFTVSRQQLIVSLFNRERKQSWSADSTLMDFINNAIDPVHPQLLNFKDSNWYAEASCTFTYKGKPLKIPVIMHIRSEKNRGAKWMIAGIGDCKQLNEGGDVNLTYKSDYLPNTKYISTPSHATKFVELSNVFLPTMNANYYFEPNILNNIRVKHFIDNILQGKLKFSFVGDVKYHFYQIPDRIFVVEYFNRPTFNAGWLINNMRKVDQKEKETSLKSLLQI